MTEATSKPRIATVWLGGCSGCHMSFLDLDERLIELAQLADVVSRRSPTPRYFPRCVDVTLVEGAVANNDHLECCNRSASEHGCWRRWAIAPLPAT